MVKLDFRVDELELIKESMLKDLRCAVDEEDCTDYTKTLEGIIKELQDTIDEENRTYGWRH